MKHFLLILILGLLFIPINPESAASQNIDNIDFASVRVDDLSDSQIRQLWSRAQEENMSVQDITTLAEARGMSSAEASRLRTRLNEVRTRTDRPDTERDGDVLRQIELDPVRERTREVEERDSDELRVFGSDLFRRGVRTFEPSFNIPTPIDYTLGAGDEIVINIWGAAEQTYNLTVNPEGVIRISNLGPIHLDGLTIQEARERIINRLQNIYSGLNPDRPEEANTFAEVSLGNVRSIKVTVMGEVSEPGSYTINSLSTVFNALYAAGGPTRSGTYRNIQVIRDREIISTLDIYDFLVYGDQTDNIRLRDQDIIKIDPYINRIRLQGEVKRQGLFELKEGETLGDLIEFAAGFTENAYTKRLVLRRTTELQRSISDVMWPEGSELEMRGGDQLRVRQLIDRFENRVEINGAVFKEGEYELTEGMMLTDLIEKAEGLREDAFLNRGVIMRTMDDLRIENVPFSLEDIMDGTADDILLKKDDQVQIASLFDLEEERVIRIRGAVNDAGEFPFVENLTISDAIYLADGFRDEAAPYRVEISRRLTGEDRFIKGDRLAERFEFEVDENLRFAPEDQDFILNPFDQIFVRRQPNYRAQQTVEINGEVNFPGSYVIDVRNARISDLINWAGGLSDYAYPRGASLRRVIENEELNGVEEFDMLTGEVVITEDPTRKVGIRLTEIMRNPGGPMDLKLRPGDVLEIPTELQTIRVEGEVLFPVMVRYDSGMSLRDAVDRAGGFTDRALRKRSYVVYANGEVDRSKRFLFFRRDPDIEPGATIIIPREEERERLSPQERVAIYSAVVSMAAIVTNTIFQIRR